MRFATLIARLRGLPVADEQHRHRALPRRGEPRARGRHGLHDARHRLQRRDPPSGRDPAETERGITWARETFASLTPYLAPTRYVNYLEDDAIDPAAVAYGPNLGASERDQNEVRRGQLLPAQRQHPAAVATGGRVTTGPLIPASLHNGLPGLRGRSEGAVIE